jgi:hypothetical protein
VPTSLSHTQYAGLDGRGRSVGASIDRDGLLKTLFPNGIPAQEDVIRAINGLLDDAERLARVK